MQKTLDEIRDLIEGPMKEMDISICSIDYVIENNYPFLKIVLDNINLAEGVKTEASSILARN